MSSTNLPAKDIETGDPEFDPTDHSDFGGVAPTEDEQFEEYWGSDKTERFYFPDGKQFIEFRKLNEGQRVRYQGRVNRDITVERTSGNARMKVDQGTERHALLVEACVAWNLKRRVGGRIQEVTFSKGKPGANFEQWLDTADPAHVDALEKAVRKLNPFLVAELSVSEIDEMIHDLEQQREDAVKREQGNAPSTSR